MMKILSLALMAVAIASGTHRISYVETNGNWVYLYDDNGRCRRYIHFQEGPMDLYLGQERKKDKSTYRKVGDAHE